MDAAQQSATPRLSVQDVQRLHRLLEGDPRVEQMILDFILAKYGAKGLWFLDVFSGYNMGSQVFRRQSITLLSCIS